MNLRGTGLISRYLYLESKYLPTRYPSMSRISMEAVGGCFQGVAVGLHVSGIRLSVPWEIARSTGLEGSHDINDD